MRANEVGPFLKWARRKAPALYAGIMRDVPGAEAFAGHQLQGFASSLSTLASKVGSYVAKNSPQLIETTGAVLLAKQQAKIAKATGVAPSVSPAMTQASMPQLQTPDVWPLQPGIDYGTPQPRAGFTLSSVPGWVWGAGAGLLVLAVLRARRR